MKKIGRRDVFLIVSIIILICGVLFTSDVFKLGSIPEDDGLWYITGPYEWNDNESYSVFFHGVNFTFLYYNNHRYLDAPLPVLFVLTFLDGTAEELYLGIGGWTISDRVNFSQHENPKAAIFVIDTNELHYSWFYAVEM